MPVEMIGWVTPRISSEIIPAAGPPFDPAVVASSARLHEQAGFDTVLIGYFSHAPDGFLISAHAAANTTHLRFLLAHRPGFVAPTLAARKLATLDELTGGRLAVHIISGGSDIDQARDGDFSDHAARYRRSREYVQVMKRVWLEAKPFDHEGEFYRVAGAYSEIRCRQQPHIPIYGGGGSDEAIRCLAPVLDVFMLWGEPLADTAAFMHRVRDAAGPHASTPTFSLSTRPIIARTEAQAWDRAHAILEQITVLNGGKAPAPHNVGSKRLLAAAAAADVHDTCLWARIAAATGARGNSTALVGTPDTVARAMLEYYKLGATSLLIRGYDPVPDTEAYGSELIPRLRDLVAAYDREQGRA
ncbi:MAG: LLM class flavin-dependent oxidoreductase [Hyphomicrobiaceae bacterium]